MNHGMNGAAAQSARGSVMCTRAASQLQGGTLSDPRPLTRLEGAHGSIEGAVGSLRERVGILSARLSGVLSPPEPSTESGTAGDSSRLVVSPAVSKAESLADEVRAIERTVIDMLERLEA